MSATSPLGPVRFRVPLDGLGWEGDPPYVGDSRSIVMDGGVEEVLITEVTGTDVEFELQL